MAQPMVPWPTGCPTTHASWCGSPQTPLGCPHQHGHPGWPAAGRKLEEVPEWLMSGMHLGSTLVQRDASLLDALLGVREHSKARFWGYLEGREAVGGPRQTDLHPGCP